MQQDFTNKTILTGVTPSGDSMHLGNYFGAMKPLVDLGQKSNLPVYCFVADLHALTTVQDREVLEHNIQNVIINYLAFGVDDTERFVFFRQSQVPAHSELMVVLGNFIGLGQMKRMHAFKDKLQKGTDEGNINMGLFNYPILMAADILLYESNLVPVGADQKQHVEIARDIAQNFNRLTGSEVLVVPEPLISEETGKIVGTDGERKMSKSLGNIVGIFDESQVIKKQIQGAYTDPNRIHATDPGRIEGNTVFAYHGLINDDREEVAQLRARYEKGKVGDAEVKERLLAAHQRYFAPLREKRDFYLANPARVAEILEMGRERAERKAAEVLNKVKKAVGL
ncbi:tryptophan--tRNA ligase [Microgenomates group bacterium]|nr:tryptophan--tRNA ligase [Microgenomates group bacterium]